MQRYKMHQVTKCPDDPSKWNDYVIIRPSGWSELLNISLHMICDCPCESQGVSDHNIVHTPFTVQIILKCCCCVDRLRTALGATQRERTNVASATAQTTATESSANATSRRSKTKTFRTSVESETKSSKTWLHSDVCQVKRCLCLSSPTDNTSLPCTGRGECVCGVCECNDPRYIGDYCECDTLNCDQHDNKLCNGRHSPVSQTLKQT